MARKKERRQRLERTVAHIQQQWGQEALRQGASRRRPSHIATGFAALDEALGIGGVPKGRITTLSGAPTSGKVTLAARVLAQAQKGGRAVAYVDVEQTCDADYLERCGVRLRDMLVVRPQDAIQGLEMALTLAGKSEVAAILFDHWRRVTTNRAADNEAAALLGQMAGPLGRSRTSLLVLEDALPLWRHWLGDNSALAHYASLHLAIRRERWLLQGPDVRGYSAAVSIEKNKLGPAGKTVPIEIHFNGTVRGDGI